MKAKGQVPKDDGWKQKYAEPPRPDTSRLPLPTEGWLWVRLGSAADVQLGQQRDPVHAAADVSYPYVRTANITWHGLDLSDVKRMGFPDPRRYRLEPGDVLLSEASGSPSEVGKPAMWRGEIADCCYQKTLLRVRSYSSGAAPEWLHLNFMCHAVLGRFAKMAPGVGILHLTAERMLEWPLPLAPLAEQERIVAEVGDGAPLRSQRSYSYKLAARPSPLDSSPPGHPQARLRRQARRPGPDRQARLRPPRSHPGRAGGGADDKCNVNPVAVHSERRRSREARTMAKIALHVEGAGLHRAPVLRDLLDVLVVGCQQATRLRVDGRTPTPGTVPGWLESVASFDVSFADATSLELESPPFAQALTRGLPRRPARGAQSRKVVPRLAGGRPRRRARRQGGQ